MKHGAVHPARVGRDAQGLPISLDHRERYHPHDGAFTQAHEVFLAGNGLPARHTARFGVPTEARVGFACIALASA